MAPLSEPRSSIALVVMNHLKTYSSRRLFRNIQYIIPAMYSRTSVNPVSSNWLIMESESIDSPRNTHITTMIIVIPIPVMAPIRIPSRVGKEREISLPSTRKNQYVGSRKIHALQTMKKTWESVSSSLNLRLKRIERVGTKPTSNIGTNAPRIFDIVFGRDDRTISLSQQLRTSFTKG